MKFLVILTLVILNGLAALVNANNNKFHTHDRVAVVANTVGPFNNPTETYHVSKYEL